MIRARPFGVLSRRIWSSPTFWAGSIVVLIGIAYFVWIGEIAFPVDDAYITQHSARYLFARDPAWPDATWLDGTTSVLHVGIIGTLALVMPAELAQGIVAIAASAIYAMGLAELGKAFGLRPLLSSGVVALGLLTAGVFHQLLNGLETGLALATVTWVLVALRWSEKRLVRTFPVLCGLAPFVRPELSALSFALVVSFGIARFRHTKERLRSDLTTTVVWGLAVFLPLVTLMLFATGSPIPTTIAAKRFFFAEGCLPFAEKLTRWVACLRGAGRLLGPVIGGILLLPFFRHGWSLFIFAIAFLGAYLWQFPDGLSHYEHRYLYVLLPLALWGIVCATARPRKWIGLAVGAIALVFGVVRLPATVRTQQGTLRFTRVELAGVAEWLHQHAAPGSTILVHDAGYVAAVPGLKLVDIVGLKTPSSVDVHREVTWPTCGRARLVANDIIARAAHPDYFVLRETWDRSFRFNGGFRLRGWDVTRVDVERFGAAYGVFTLTPPSKESDR